MITTLLVANRGEITRRIFRTARSMGIRCVAVFAASDADAPFVREADEAYRLPGGYLDGRAVLDAARRARADAVHPGYGFLSENAAFAADVVAAGLCWVGPPSEVIGAMGDKIRAKQLAQAAGVPVLASGSDAGFPLLVKAAAGGGGKGMRIVEREEDLAEARAAAEREALAAFGDGTVFLERYVARSRHIEIQILGDQHGNVIHLGERECSIQRRHQKIVEESPSPAVDDTMRSAMGDAALRLARSIGYHSAGTVEFLVDDATREFFFLEVNTRLQVEHPVTELVTGLDLVREQLRMAVGEPLGLTQADVSFSGHAVEVRLYAEDAGAGFLPATGTLVAFEPPEDPAVRWDSGVEQGSVVGVDYDPMLAKVIGHAPTRLEATTKLARALEGLHLGGVTTNRDFLVSTLRHPSFAAGDTTTDFIERAAPNPSLALEASELEHLSAAAALWLQGRNRAEAPVLSGLPSGWRNARLPDQRVVLRRTGEDVEVEYRRLRDGSFALGDRIACVHDSSPHHIVLEVDGRRAKHRITASGAAIHIQGRDGTVSFEVVPRFATPGAAGTAGGFVAPMPGVVLDVRCAAGDAVRAGDVLVVLEAMKMEHHMKAPADGTVAEVRITAGQHVENGAVLLVFEER